MFKGIAVSDEKEFRWGYARSFLFRIEFLNLDKFNELSLITLIAFL